MDPKLLSQLCEVIVQGSLSRAAESLRVTQPTLTRNMKAIEDAVGAPVLRRTRYGVTPTKLGLRLSEQGRIVTSAMSMAEETVQQWRIGLIGEVRLGVGTMLCASEMPGFFKSNPMKDTNFAVRVFAAEPIKLVQKLRNQEIDMALLPSYSQSFSDNVKQDVLFTDEVCVVAGSQSPLLKLPGKIKPQLLYAQPWMSLNNIARFNLYNNQAILALGIESIVPRFQFDGDLTAPMALLQDSDMLAIAPRRFAQYYVDKGGIHFLDINIDFGFTRRNLVLLTNKENINNTGVIELSTMLKDYFRNLYYSDESDVQNTKDHHVADFS